MSSLVLFGSLETDKVLQSLLQKYVRWKVHLDMEKKFR